MSKKKNGNENEKVKQEAKVEAKAESKAETKTETKADGKSDAKDAKDTKDAKGGKKKLSVPSLIGLVVCFLVAVGCAVYLGNYFLKSKKSEEQVAEVKDMLDMEDVEIPMDEKMEYELVDGQYVQKKFVEQYKKNHDFVGWMTIKDTKVDYPVMQHEGDNEFYIHRNFDQQYDGAGLLFMDLNCNFLDEPTTNLGVVYGHNMKAGTMFAALTKYKDENFYNVHKYIRFDTLHEDALYEVIAAYPTEIYRLDDTTHFKYYEYYNLEDKETFDSYVENSKKLTPYTIDTTATYGDTLLVLSTCAYHAEDGRYVVVAKKIDSKQGDIPEDIPEDNSEDNSEDIPEE